MTPSVKETKERPLQKEMLTPTQKNNLEETKRKFRGALEQLSRYNPGNPTDFLPIFLCLRNCCDGVATILIWGMDRWAR